MSTTTKKNNKTIPPALKVQCALRLNEAPYQKKPATPMSVAKRFGIHPKDAIKFQRQFNAGTLLKTNGKTFNPEWRSGNYLAHPVDSEVMVDVMKGSVKDESALLGFFDTEYDEVNGVYHFEWQNNDILNLLASLPYRILEIIRSTKPTSELHVEALMWLHCDLFVLICKVFGFDHEELIAQLPYYQKMHQEGLLRDMDESDITDVSLDEIEEEIAGKKVENVSAAVDEMMEYDDLESSESHYEVLQLNQQNVEITIN